MIRLIAFDLDGTLVDSSGDLATAVNAMLARLRPGTPALATEAVRGFIGEGAQRLVARSLLAAGLPHSPEAALPVFAEAYGACLLETTRPYPGVPEALSALRGRALAVLTNKPGGFTRTILQALALAPHFQAVLGGDDAPRKPSPEGLQRLMRELGALPSETLLVGDSALDVATARAAGALSVGVTYGLDPAGLRAAGPDLTLDDLRALPAYVARLLC